MKIGLFGGTFDPVHTGHLVLAQECWHSLALDKVIFIPAYVPPHKDMEGGASAADRLNMLRCALEGDERFEISTYEIDRGGKSYSIDTIRHFRQKFSGDDGLFFLAGADSAESLSTWKDVDEILRLTHFVIATRPGWGQNSPYEQDVRRIVIPGMDISSSVIRDRIRRRQPIDYLVPSAVVRYIRNKGLYRE
ncbi:MAG: nicotinate-nucleotide adenylyltransferase [Candidatus Makaraimicrobium thalassicum]|nr:MAG: nicotinate-nucleotide adenylyltransferase [Candidatus Omnitrophota bacterium]